MNTLLKWIRQLSLDAVACALSVSFYFSVVFDASLPGSYWLALGLTTLLVFLVNNFANSYLPGNYSNKTELHRLRSLRKLLSRLSLFCLVSLVILMFFIPGEIILFGAAGILLLTVYLVINQVQHYSKKTALPRELIVALFFTAGTAGVPLIYDPWRESTHWITLVAVLFLILSNTLIFAILDFDHNQKTGIKSIAVRTSVAKTRTMALLSILISGILFLLFTLLSFDPTYGIIGLTMVSLYALMLLIIAHRQSKYFTFLADLVLLLPLILSLF
ncbi:MAG: hypothetical protein JW801_06330 [Bacteroidales bacterium]|nr:hypothetical protein [Bacteroidales bacterium]